MVRLSRAATAARARPWTATVRSAARSGRCGRGASGCRRWSGGRADVPAGVAGKEVVQLIDLLPTFVAAAGGLLSPAWHVDGINLLDVWTGKSAAPERTIFWEWQSERADQIAAHARPVQAGGHRRRQVRALRRRRRPRRAPRRVRGAPRAHEGAPRRARQPGSRPKSTDSDRALIRHLLISNALVSVTFRPQHSCP